MFININYKQQPLIIPTFLSDEAIDILVKLLEFDVEENNIF